MLQIKENKKEIKNQNGIKIYINEDYYSDSFGSQWNKFSKTQIDNDQNSHSFERFFNETGLNKDDFTNKNILEVGSGAGRFTDIILKHTKANELSKMKGLNTFGLIGFDGGKAKEILDEYIHFKIDDMQVVEDLQTIVFHYIIKRIF